MRRVDTGGGVGQVQEDVGVAVQFEWAPAHEVSPAQHEGQRAEVGRAEAGDPRTVGAGGDGVGIGQRQVVVVVGDAR